MASVTTNIHLKASDKPFADRLDGGSIAIWLEGEHMGPTLIGPDDALAALRDAITAFLVKAEVRAAALSDLAASDAELLS